MIGGKSQLKRRLIAFGSETERLTMGISGQAIFEPSAACLGYPVLNVPDTAKNAAPKCSKDKLTECFLPHEKISSLSKYLL